MYTKLGVGFVALACVCGLSPFFVSAQEVSESEQGSLETEIRTALGAQAVVEGITPDEFEELVQLMVAQAEQEGISPQDVAAAYAPSSEIEYGEGGEESLDTYPIASQEAQQTIMVVVGVLVLLSVLFAVWRKMEAGGALGSGRDNTTGVL